MYYWLFFNMVTFSITWYCKFFSQVFQNTKPCHLVGIKKHGVFKRKKKNASSTLLLNFMMPVFTRQTVLWVALIKLRFKIYISQTICDSMPFQLTLDSYIMEVALTINCCLLQKPVQIAMLFTHICIQLKQFLSLGRRKDSSEW